ncbi:MAG TPA: YkgJ family cysteine cluster protein [Pyrinomonadaceae bacterium]|jgi:Fe-S-cluster containining protein
MQSANGNEKPLPDASGAKEMETLRQEVAEGFMYAHTRENANTSKVLEVAAFSYALIELLAERGVISVAELDERKREVGKRLVEKFTEKGIGVALTDDEGDKYSHQSEVVIDCEERMSLCRGMCCRLKFALTVQDLEEGKVKWDLGRPYMIRHGANGYCFHNDRETHQCTVYENRPLVCRSYDCRKDKRIWTDFENRIINPELENLFPKPDATRSSDAATCETYGTRADEDAEVATDASDGNVAGSSAAGGVAFIPAANGASRLYQLSRTSTTNA